MSGSTIIVRGAPYVTFAPIVPCNVTVTDLTHMTPLPPSYDALQREVMDLRKRLDKLEREAEARDKTKHYPPVKPLRPVNFKTLGRKIADDSGVELD